MVRRARRGNAPGDVVESAEDGGEQPVEKEGEEEEEEVGGISTLR